MASIITCGKQSLHIINGESGAEEWSLIWAESDALDANEKEWLAWYNSGTDEIKPNKDNSAFLISSVCGLLAEVHRETKQVDVIGWAPGAHSIEALPNDYVAAAISHKPALPPGAPDSEGDRFQLYHKKKARRILWEQEAYGAHGVLWDQRRGCLWALDYHHLYIFEFDSGKESLKELKRIELPAESGHDLNWCDQFSLYVTTGPGVYIFDIGSGEFLKHPTLGDCKKVKGISRHPASDETVYVYPDPGEQVHTSADLHFVNNPKRKLTAPHAVYKPRWLNDL